MGRSPRQVVKGGKSKRNAQDISGVGFRCHNEKTGGRVARVLRKSEFIK